MIKAKTLVKDKFWIVEENGQKLGTLQKKENNGWIFLSKADKRQVYVTQESLFQKFGINIFEENKQAQEQIKSLIPASKYNLLMELLIPTQYLSMQLLVRRRRGNI